MQDCIDLHMSVTVIRSSHGDVLSVRKHPRRCRVLHRPAVVVEVRDPDRDLQFSTLTAEGRT
jgi:hypothetical protein